MYYNYFIKNKNFDFLFVMLNDCFYDLGIINSFIVSY